jgi:hypothetical protein
VENEPTISVFERPLWSSDIEVQEIVNVRQSVAHSFSHVLIMRFANQDICRFLSWEKAGGATSSNPHCSELSIVHQEWEDVFVEELPPPANYLIIWSTWNDLWKYYDYNNITINKKVWEVLIAFISLISQQFFVAAGMPLPRLCLPTIGGYTCRPRDTRIQ